MLDMIIANFSHFVKHALKIIRCTKNVHLYKTPTIFYSYRDFYINVPFLYIRVEKNRNIYKYIEYIRIPTILVGFKLYAIKKQGQTTV